MFLSRLTLHFNRRTFYKRAWKIFFSTLFNITWGKCFCNIIRTIVMWPTSLIIYSMPCLHYVVISVNWRLSFGILILYYFSWCYWGDVVAMLRSWSYIWCYCYDPLALHPTPPDQFTQSTITQRLITSVTIK